MSVQIVPTVEDGDKCFDVDVADPVSVKEAMERFNDLVNNQKRMAVAKNADGTHSKISAFDANVDTLFMPQRQGG